jgi:hypothetical protein
MNQIVKLELVDLAAVELREAVTHPAQQCAQLFPVIYAAISPRASRRAALSPPPRVLRLGSATDRSYSPVRKREAGGRPNDGAEPLVDERLHPSVVATPGSYGGRLGWQEPRTRVVTNWSEDLR